MGAGPLTPFGASAEQLAAEKARRGKRLLIPAAVAVGLAVLIAAAILWVRFARSPGEHAAAIFPPLPVAGSLIGHPAPDFTLPILSGGALGSEGMVAGGSPARPAADRLSLRGLRGRPVVLNFWASWCAPCRAETPLLVRLHRVYGPRGVVFVGVDTEDEAADARRFIGQYHVDYTIVASSSEKLMAAYAIPGLPTTIFIGPDGVIRDREVGGFIGPDGESALITRLDQLLR